MADFEIFKPPRGNKEYITKYDAFITEMEGWANEIINAREGEADLVTNLANYLQYTLGDDVNGAGAYKCTNMANAENDQDYITKAQAEAMSATGANAINDLSPGSLNPNDILVVNSTGTFLTGRPTSYTTVSGSFASNYNGNYNVNVASVSASTTLPAGVAGGCIGYADLSGSVNGTHTITITPNGTEKIHGTNDSLLINNYAHISFVLVYSGSTYGWVLTNLLR